MRVNHPGAAARQQILAEGRLQNIHETIIQPFNLVPFPDPAKSYQAFVILATSVVAHSQRIYKNYFVSPEIRTQSRSIDWETVCAEFYNCLPLTSLNRAQDVLSDSREDF